MINLRKSLEEFNKKFDDKTTEMWENFKLKLPAWMLKIFDVSGKFCEKIGLAELINTIVFVVVMVIIIRFFIGEIRWIPSGSMHPTLIEGDRIVVERFSRFFTKPKRGDIMVFYPPSTILDSTPIGIFERLTGIYCKDIAYIKRVVGMPGDKIEIKEESNGAAYVYVNDKKYTEDYIKSVYEYPKCPQKIEPQTGFREAGIYIMSCGPFKLGEDEYFMMGDNRGNSQDSRYWGTLKGNRFVGRAVIIFWPLSRIRILHHLKTTL